MPKIPTIKDQRDNSPIIENDKKPVEGDGGV